MAFDFDNIVTAPVFAIFGEPVIYTPFVNGVAGTPLTLASGGVFDQGYKSVDFDVGPNLSTTHPVCSVRAADFLPFLYPNQGDQLSVRGAAFNITDVNADSHGWIKLNLSNVTGTT